MGHFTFWISLLSYHLSRCGFATTDAVLTHCACRAGMGRKCGSVSRCRWCAAAAVFLLAMRVSAREEKGR